MMRADRSLLVVLGTALLLVACGGGEEPPVGDESSPAPVATEDVGDPTPVVTEQGGTYFGVYLAVGEGPDVEDAINYLTEERGLAAGQDFSIGDVACDQGAEEALGAGAGPMRVAVYFDSQEEAEAWSQTLPAPPIAIAQVETFCLD
jgi:hypothetical protein